MGRGAVSAAEATAELSTKSVNSRGASVPLAANSLKLRFEASSSFCVAERFEHIHNAR